MAINWQVLSVVINCIIALISALLIRWVGGIVKDLQQQIIIAVQRLELQFKDQYATKSELASVREEFRDDLNIVGKMESGFDAVKFLIRERQRTDPPATSTGRL